ncbi:unnamed protein product [Pleuronectes platessa]|uniref:Uncharacterized protein n=1 Tax=Pleuronectes platessa TaxID=8262 RepID=A0A9N7YGE6_PLEPL|nr:unnamed protein product [Pleuronectes platessa]
MASEVYSATTAPNPKSSWCQVPSERLDKLRFLVKVSEVPLQGHVGGRVLQLQVRLRPCSSKYGYFWFQTTKMALDDMSD